MSLRRNREAQPFFFNREIGGGQVSMVGRKPKPTALKIIQGNPGRRSLNRDEPKPGPLGKPPSLVKARAVALAKWLELVSKECWGPVITLADADALEAYCLLYDRMSEAETKAAQFGMIIKAPSGFFVQSPWVGIANTCRRDRESASRGNHG